MNSIRWKVVATILMAIIVCSALIRINGVSQGEAISCADSCVGSCKGGYLIFEEDFSGDLTDKWNLVVFNSAGGSDNDAGPTTRNDYGNPPPCFDNKGDSWCGNGIFSKQRFDYADGLIIMCDLWIKDARYEGCWVDATFGIARELPGSGYTRDDGVYVDNDHCDTPLAIYIRFWVDGPSCWMTPPERREHAWIRYIIINEHGDVEYFEESGDDYLEEWHTFTIYIRPDRHVEFYRDGTLVYITGNKTSLDYNNMPLLLGTRSHSSYGPALHDNVKVYTISPWADIDSNGVPNYIDIPEFSVAPLVTTRTIELKIWPGIKIGEIYWPVSIYVISPATDISDMLEELGKWGVSYEDYEYYLVLPIIVEAHNLSDLLNWLSRILPEELINATMNTLCTDGALRLMVLPMIKFIPTELGIDDTIDLLKTFKELVKGDVEAVLDKLMDLLTAFDVALYLIKEGAPVQAIYMISWGDIVRNLMHIKGLIEDVGQIIIEVLEAIAAGTLTSGATIAALALKAFNFIVDYIVEWLPIPNGLVRLLNYVEGILSFKDPEGARIDVQILNTTSGQLILGYDLATGENYTYFDHGFWFYDEDKQVFLISKDALPLNLTIRCSSTGQSSGGGTEVNYSLTIIDPGFNETEVFGGLLSVGETTSSTMELTADGELKVSPLRLCVSFSNTGPIQGEDVLVSVNVTDEAGNPVSGAEVKLSLDGVVLAMEEVGPGQFRAVINTTTLIGIYVVYILAEAEGYLQNMAVHAIEVYPFITISLVEGWNLIGLPIEPLNGSVVAIFSEHLCYVKAIYAYYNGTWYYWLGTDMPNTLSDLRPGYGYWVFVSRSFNLTIIGRRDLRPEMAEGWNLIAVTGFSGVPVEEYLEGYDWRAVYGYVEENGTWLYYIRGVGGSLTMLEPGEGYWVYIDPPVGPSSAPSELSEEISDSNPSWINARDSPIRIFSLLGLLGQGLEELRRRFNRGQARVLFAPPSHTDPLRPKGEKSTILKVC